VGPFRDRGTAAVAAATTAALAAMEVADVTTRTTGNDRVRDAGTGPRFGAATGVAIATGTASLLRRPAGTFPRSRSRFLAGIALTWLGIGCNRWARATLGSQYRPMVAVRDDHEVVATGPYRLVRHPMYLGSLLICAGIGLALDSRLARAAWWLGPPTALVQRIRVEESVLVEELGDAYGTFAATRARLVPGLW